MNINPHSPKDSTPPKAGFTLIELLIVIGILAILATVVVLVLNPTEMFKQARDSQRLSETDALNQAILLYQTNGGSNLGESSYIYISIATSTSDCGYTSENNPLNLPNPTPRTYICAPSSTYRNIDGTGWVPVNFTNLSIQSPLTILPIDPVNIVANMYTSATISLNTWTHVLVVRNGINIKMYFNNVQVLSQDASEIMDINFPEAVRLGTNIPPQATLRGSLDEVTYYNKALADSERTNLYSTSVGRHP